MRKWLLIVHLTVLACMANSSFADEPASKKSVNISSDLPTNEKEFVDAVNKFNKKQIVEKLGEPSNVEDLKLKGSDKVVASIWHYHNLNTAADGSYYQTTELDFIEDNVAVVVFLNNDGEEGASGGQKYELPGAVPEL